MVPLAMEILAKHFVEVHVHEVYQGRYSIELVDMRSRNLRLLQFSLLGWNKIMTILCKNHFRSEILIIEKYWCQIDNQFSSEVILNGLSISEWLNFLTYFFILPVYLEISSIKSVWETSVKWRFKIELLFEKIDGFVCIFTRSFGFITYVFIIMSLKLNHFTRLQYYKCLNKLFQVILDIISSKATRKKIIRSVSTGDLIKIELEV